MKKKTHPKYFDNAKVTCACGNTFTTGSTKQTIKVELCSACHPFYTGKQRIVDSENLVKKFKERQKAKKKNYVSKKKKRAKRRSKVQTIEGKEKVTLKDMLEKVKQD